MESLYAWYKFFRANGSNAKVACKSAQIAVYFVG